MDIELIPLQESDLELVRGWRNSPEVSAYMYTSDQITEKQQKAWFENIKDGVSSKYWIISYDKKKVGLASLTEINRNLDSCFWAFYLGDSSIRGAGIGLKTEYNVLKFVFEELRLNKLRCEVFVFNDNVIRMHEKVGFRREAYYREHCLKDGKYLDVVGLAMLKSEWDRNRDVIFKSIYQKE